MTESGVGVEADSPLCAGDFARAPSSILSGRATEYFWQGPGLLAIKTFRGGPAHYTAGTGHFTVEPDSYLLLNHGQEYSITIEADRPVESFCVSFSLDTACDVAHNLGAALTALLENAVSPLLLPAVVVERTYPLDGEIAGYLARLRAPADPARQEELFHGLLGAILRRQVTVRAEAESLSAARAATRLELYRRLHLAREYAEASLDQPIGLDDMARAAGLSSNHLLRTFPSLFGRTPYQYLLARRMDRAKRLLRDSSLPITQVCFEVGFESVGSFSSRFKYEVGVSPGGYRRSFR